MEPASPMYVAYDTESKRVIALNRSPVETWAYHCHIAQAVANLVDDSALYLGSRKDGVYRLFEPGQPINTGHKDVLYPSCLQVSDHAQLEVSSFRAIPNPMSKYVSMDV